MKSYIFLILSLLFAPIAWAQNAASPSGDSASSSLPDENVEALAIPADSAKADAATFTGEQLAAMADSAYAADNYRRAQDLYSQALKVDGSSSVLFYNLGNAYYRQGNLGMAIVNYERALKLDPTNADARKNLEFVNSKITDKQIIDNGSYMQSVWEGTVGYFKADTWAMLAMVLFAIFLGSLAVYIFSSAVKVKKAGFFGGLIVFILTVCAVVISFAAANRVNSNNYAIILPPASQLSTSPREARSQSEQAFLLHEGTKVEIIDSISNPGEGMWYEVMVGRGERAWVKADEVERI